MIASYIAHAFLVVLVSAMKLLPRNGFLFAYTITGKDGTKYMTRALFPRLGSGVHRWMLHWWHRPDADPDMHNHPWAKGRSIILMGGYTEERLNRLRPPHIRDIMSRVGETNRLTTVYRRGDRMALDAGDFHRVTHLLPRTWTLFRAGKRTQGWGFLVDDESFVPFEQYFASRGIAQKVHSVS
jgi:hypothetical protein